MLRIILILIGVLLPSLAHADLASMLNSNGLNDLSFKYLQDIFGVVDGVLHGSGTQIMGAIFGAFNSAVLTLGFIVMSYVFFVSTINTAHEGEVLGRNWSSIWIPLRIVGSTALIVPKASGYSMIQIFMMTVVVYGIAGADKVMGAALEYLANGGVLIQSSPPPSGGTVDVAGNILKSMTCMNGVYNIVVNNANTNNTAPPAKFLPSATPEVADGTYSIFFPSADAAYTYNNTSYKGICGNVTWNDDDVSSGGSIFGPSNSNDPAKMRQIGVQQMIFDLQPYAQDLANSMIPITYPNDPNPPAPTSVQDIVSANNISLVLAAADYKGIMLPYFTQRDDAYQAAALALIKGTASDGWIMLGSLYFALAQLNNNVNGNDKNGPKANFSMDTTVSGYQFIKESGQLQNIYCQIESGATCPDNVLTATKSSSLSDDSSNFIDKNIAYSAENTSAGGLYKAGATQKGGFKAGSSGLGTIVQIILYPLFGPLYGIIYNMQSLFDAENQNTDPILAVSGLGSNLVDVVTQLWFGIAAVVVVLAITMGMVPCINSGGFGVLSFLIWFVPTFSALMLAMFVTGATMAFYVPLIPFILFTFGAIGWFATVIEGMIAAPLVALGLASPEGHNVFGHSSPAILLILNIFLRPVLMVIAFFAATILSHVGLWLINKGYGVAFISVFVTNIGNLGIGGVLWSLIAALVIYLSLVMAVINQTFGLIHQLPDELLRWLGGGQLRPLGSSPGDALSSVQGDVKDKMGTAAQSAEAFSKDANQQAQVYGNKKSGKGETNFEGTE